MGTYLFWTETVSMTEKGTGRKATLNLKFIGTSADVDFAQRRDFQSGFEYLSRSKIYTAWTPCCRL
ncbi:hypothetical protein SAMN03159297_05565 [Pseudomonas sp. NFACC45]|nr:hypothetical protein SAMN03159297_05565 [Pseudomonas sp. NFACC45]